MGSLAAGDLERLVEAQVPESERIEYKRELPAKGDPHEFLADVSSFANTFGGVLLFGVETKRDEHNDTGIPAELVGVGEVNAGALELRLLEMLHHGLQPRLVPDPAFQFIDVPNANGPILAIGVSRSFAAPHIIWTNRSGKFFRRTSVGKLQADVEQIRRMFLETEEWAREARAFAEQRIRDAVSERLGFGIAAELRTFVHVLPLGHRPKDVDLVGAQRTLLERGAAVLDRSNLFNRFDLDGYFVGGGTEPFPEYLFWLRSGAVEWGTDLFRDIGGVFSLDLFSRRLLEDFPSLLSTLTATLGVEPPLSVHVTLLGMRGLKASESPRPSIRGFRRDELALPAVVIADLNADLAEVLSPALDVLWQSAGYERWPRSKASR